MQLFLRDDLAAAWQGKDPFEQASRQQGDIFREREGRRTLRFQAGSRSYFLKYHAGIGWREIIKNLTQAKLPVIGAMQEVQAVDAVRAAGLDTMTVVGYGARGLNPARQESFIVTEDLANTLSLEEVGEAWLEAGKVPVLFKRQLIERVAHMAGTMHRAGINHRDFYIAHFLIPEQAVREQDAQAPLYLIDLHRSQVRARVPWRWQVKDLGGLYFSSARYGLSRGDVFRFLKTYFGEDLRTLLQSHARLLRASRKEGEKIYRRYYEIEPAFPLQYCDHPGKNI
ncbi:lipopolysaccharide core heptose(I) kinase RfaP [Alcanivorax sp. S6407]|uniref:lipopolysaccharide core heptose(I) kinase RfaP n=1 Tax=Alcanivorax sp. S6407 TaxID=2926424 RepID=UPI001FF20420|nr:lipopolysaccharide core heptose(I) kinase RfaP [Alcanivorax sp. S6407]MCK0153645.1 lipopolysaccharide core heptose(I) kinase RfaP [Alcanivorax sp. S6407]